MTGLIGLAVAVAAATMLGFALRRRSRRICSSSGT